MMDMRSPPLMSGGHYNEEGKWIRTKFCFLPCYERCNCQPPNGVYQLPDSQTKEEAK